MVSSAKQAAAVAFMYSLYNFAYKLNAVATTTKVSLHLHCKKTGHIAKSFKGHYKSDFRGRKNNNKPEKKP